MESTLPMVEITVKPEPVECEEPEESEQSEINQQTKGGQPVILVFGANTNPKVPPKDDELWIKMEQDDESQDTKEEEQSIPSENEAKVDEEALNDEFNKKDTEDLKSKLPLKKRLEKRIKEEDEVFPKEEKPDEKPDAEDSEQQEDGTQQPEDGTQPKMETHLMYSYETLKNIEIVTIDEEERQKEYETTLKARQHMRHVCVHCALGFVLKQAFDMHMKVHAPESGEHECVLCHSRLKTADMLYKHRLRHYRRYRCLLCRMRFKDKDTAACHVMNDHTGQTFECDRCGRGFK
ncbi:hypothetical protein PYW07_011015 [Mythimna separata]|uniref:C2H2-type domain-containing protein n=1 Tax=Mythimna separata TaxID=271217 RepID=A0AAD7Y7C7_MYTSE|nr:hypothetical protein PYW07_011015 [Mythimna separata]